ncbi:hypothetical protein PN836_015910 [Ningiella sp. W23]|uniref:hypothetical protein n=1 Tax=Ningiella sp. W23 TaxID=3023715 RepID=UPI003757D511
MVFAFYFKDDVFQSVAYSPIGESTALAEAKVVNKVVSVARTDSAIDMAAQMIKERDFVRIAVNISQNNAQADGLSYMQHKKLSEAIGETLTNRLVSSDELVFQWLSIKLPAEVAIIRDAAALTAQWQLEAYANVTPGKTSDADVAAFLKQKMGEAGVLALRLQDR